MNPLPRPRAARSALTLVVMALTLMLGASATFAVPSPLVGWVQRAGGTGAGQAYGMGVSALPDGSSIVTGYFSGNATFGSTTLTNTGGNDVFAARLNADGTWAWARSAGGAATDMAMGISALADGSSIVSGYFTDAATFGGTTLTSANANGYPEAFTAKLNADGTWAWAQQAGGPGADMVRAVSALTDGSSIVTGSFAGTATFGSTSLVSAGSGDVFTAKLSAAGAWVWAQKAGGAGSDTAQGVSALSDGSSIVTGNFTGAAAFGSTSLTAAGGTDAFVARMNADGTWAWAQRGGGAGADAGQAVAAVVDGSSVVTGYFVGAATFGSTPITGTGSTDAFAARLNADGSWAWVRHAGGTGANIALGSGVASLAGGSSIVTGSFIGSAAFGDTTLTTTGGADMFTARLGADGAWNWVQRAGGTRAGADVAQGMGVAALADGSSIVTGRFAGSDAFGGTTVTATGANDVFAVRYSQPAPPADPATPGPAAANAVASDPTAPNAALTVTLLPSDRHMVSGQLLRIGVRARNAGEATAESVTSCVHLPSNMAFVSAPGALRSDRLICFRHDVLTAGSQTTGTVTVRAVAARRVRRTITGTARATNIERVNAAPQRVGIRPRRARARSTK